MARKKIEQGEIWGVGTQVDKDRNAEMFIEFKGGTFHLEKGKKYKIEEL